MDSSLVYATCLLAIGLSFTLWIIFVSLFKPTQWLTPAKKTIIITGCDSGIGLQLARYFHRQGSIVIATVLSKQSESVAELIDLDKNEGRMFIVELDLKDRTKTKKAAEEIEQLLESNQLKLHALVNNAGVCVLSELDFCTEEQIDEQLSVNLIGTIYFTKQLLPIVIQSQGKVHVMRNCSRLTFFSPTPGRIINVSSVNALQTFPGLSIYSATKAGLEAFGNTLRIELAKFDVKVINIRLGDFAKLTNIMANHKKAMEAQKKEWNNAKRSYYQKDYFEHFHWQVLKNHGFFSPPSYEQSTLFADFEEALFAVNPANCIMCAVLSLKLFIYALASLPTRCSVTIINLIVNKSIPHSTNI